MRRLVLALAAASLLAAAAPPATDSLYGVGLADLEVGETVAFQRLELVPQPDGIGRLLLPTQATVYRSSSSCLHGGQYGHPYLSGGQARGWLEAETSSGCSSSNRAETRTRFCEAKSKTCWTGNYSVKTVSAPPGGKAWAWHRWTCQTSHWRDWTHLGWTPTSGDHAEPKYMELRCNV